MDGAKAYNLSFTTFNSQRKMCVGWRSVYN